MNQVNITRRVNVEGKGRGSARSFAVTAAASVEARSSRMSSSSPGANTPTPRVVCITSIFSRMGSGRAGLQARPLLKL